MKCSAMRTMHMPMPRTPGDSTQFRPCMLRTAENLVVSLFSNFKTNQEKERKTDFLHSVFTSPMRLHIWIISHLNYAFELHFWTTHLNYTLELHFWLTHLTYAFELHFFELSIWTTHWNCTFDWHIWPTHLTYAFELHFLKDTFDLLIWTVHLNRTFQLQICLLHFFQDNVLS